MDTYIGIDYGGTKLLIGQIQEGEWNPRHLRRYDTGLTDRKEITTHLIKCLERYLLDTKIEGHLRGAGIGIIGISDNEKGVWISADHREREPIPLPDMVSQCLGVPAAIDNDVKSAAMAELLWGEGKNCSDYVYINVGTGLSAGLVSGGRLIRGCRNDAGEIGHMVLDRTSRRRCVCGRRGCAELYASGSGLHQMAVSQRKQRKTRLEFLQERERYSALRIFELAREGDDFCMELAEDAADALGCVIMNLVRVSDPQKVILGGGLAADDWFFELTRSRLDPVTMRHVTGGVQQSRFTPALAGVIGAAAVGYAKIHNL